MQHMNNKYIITATDKTYVTASRTEEISKFLMIGGIGNGSKIDTQETYRLKKIKETKNEPQSQQD